MTWMITTGADLEKEASFLWKRWRNACIAKDNAGIPSISPIEWNGGKCYECDQPVPKEATGCPNCHMSFVE